MKKASILVLLFVVCIGFQYRLDQGLKDVFKADFLIGTAVNLNQVTGNEKGADSLLLLHFNSMTPENGLKWALVHPEEDRFDFSFGDAFVKKGGELGAFLVGHTLIWHQQTPAWVFENQERGPASYEVLTARMENHIAQVVGRFKGKISGWDVVNEAFEDNGAWRQTSWYSILGTSFIEKAFRKTHEADPQAQLYYNDYNVWKPEKLDAILAMAISLREKGVKIDGIGMQGHYRLNVPTLGQIENAILRIHDAGFEVHITELDVDVLPRPSDQDGADLTLNYAQSPEFNPYTSGIPVEVERQLVDRYSALFSLFRKHSDKVQRVTLWGLHDGASWLNNWPVRGRTNYPLLFDREKSLKNGFLEKFIP